MRNIVKAKITLSIAGGTFVAQARNLQTAGWKELLGKEDEDENQEPLLPMVKKGRSCMQNEVKWSSKKTHRRNHLPMRRCFQRMTGIARFVQDKELKKILREPMDLVQKPPVQALLNYCLNAVF